MKLYPVPHCEQVKVDRKIDLDRKIKLRFRLVWRAEMKRVSVLKWNRIKQKKVPHAPALPVSPKNKSTDRRSATTWGCSRSKLSRLCYIICSTRLGTKNYFVLAREKLHDFCTSVYWRYFYWSGWCFMFHFCVSTVLIVERMINKMKPSFMQIFVYLISFVRGMQDVYQHHIWRLGRNCNHLIKIWLKRKFKIRTLLFRNLFQWSWKKFLSGFNSYAVNL